MQPIIVGVACCVLLLAGCGAKESNERSHSPANGTAPVLRSPTDVDLFTLIRQYGLTGNPAHTAMPDVASPRAQLGMKLFFSKALSGNLDVACASCHHPLLAGGDNLSLSVGVDAADPDVLGHARMLAGNQSPGVPRNAPTTFNIGLWQQFMFHDGRVGSVSGGINTPDVKFPQADPKAGGNLVQAQARFPVTSDAEMRGKSFDKGGTTQSCRELLAGRLGGYKQAPRALTQAETRYWIGQFRKAYPDAGRSPDSLVSEQHVAEVLSEYERSQVFVNSPWHDYVQGDLEALSETAKQGALLFFKGRGQGGFDCVACHRGDFFTDEGFYNVLMPALGPGKQASDGKVSGLLDKGRELVTGREEDRFRFRTPSLLNVAVTGPWGHDGAYTSLGAVVRHMLNPFEAALGYDAAQLRQPNIQTQAWQDNLHEMLRGNSDLAGQPFTDKDVRQLVAFLESLTDPCLTNPECMAKWLPPPGDKDPMGLQLDARLE
jgi:cytochrome c peroxidase